jgi:DNA-binding NtrC family response regulator
MTTELALRTVRSVAESTNVVAVSPWRDDHVALNSIFAGSKWMFKCVSTIEDAVSCIQGGCVSVIICNHELPDGNWHALLQRSEQQPRPPRFIVSWRFPASGRRAEILDAGGYDVLFTPFRIHEVVHAVNRACESWNHQWGEAGLCSRE